MSLLLVGTLSKKVTNMCKYLLEYNSFPAGTIWHNLFILFVLFMC